MSDKQEPGRIFTEEMLQTAIVDPQAIRRQGLLTGFALAAGFALALTCLAVGWVWVAKFVGAPPVQQESPVACVRAPYYDEDRWTMRCLTSDAITDEIRTQAARIRRYERGGAVQIIDDPSGYGARFGDLAVDCNARHVWCDDEGR